MEKKRIEINELVQNKGQVEGVPKNPRQWKQADLDRLKASMNETPELAEARGCIVYPLGKKYVILGGNMRYAAAKALGWKEMDCIVLPIETSAQKLREIVIKDNSNYGKWDFDMLANEWDDGRLEAWGVDVTWEDRGLELDAVDEPRKKDDSPAVCRERIIITYPKDMQAKMEEIMGTEIVQGKINYRIEDIMGEDN